MEAMEANHDLAMFCTGLLKENKDTFELHSTNYTREVKEMDEKRVLRLISVPKVSFVSPFLLLTTCFHFYH